MKVMRLGITATLLLSSVSLLAPTQAQERAAEKKDTPKQDEASRAAPLEPDGSMFEAPVLMKSDDANLGEGRLYPSPVLHDLDGDGKAEIYVGDLQGFVTVTHPGKDSVHWGKTERLQTVEGEAIEFDNW